MKIKKGFTIVEMLAIISLLAILLVLLVPNIVELSANSKISLKETKISTITVAAEKYGNDYINQFQLCNSTKYTTEQLRDNCTLSIDDLIDRDYLTADDNNKILNPETNEPFNGKLLLCFNQSQISIYAKYIENAVYSCT